MNERIQELIGECIDQRWTVTGPMFDKEKFAELIVKECAEIAKKEQAFNERYTDAKKHPQVNIDQCILMGFGL